MKKTKFQRRCFAIGMTMMIIAIVIQVANCAHVGQEWNKQDKIAAGVMLSGKTADLLSTKYALEHGCVETNPFLDEYPTDQTLVLWGIGTTLVVLGIAHLLPHEARQGLLYTLGGASGMLSFHNFMIAQ